MDTLILLVDDHPTMCESLRYVFTVAGAKEIREAATSEEAIGAIQEHAVDVVLLDVALGDDDGLEVLRKIKAIDASLPVLIHSFHDHRRLLASSYHSGAAGYVIKGTDKNELIGAVRQAARGRSNWTIAQTRQIRQADNEL